MDNVKIDEYLTLNGWNFFGNKIVGAVNGFIMSIEMELYDKDEINDGIKNRFEQAGVGFILSVFSQVEGKRTLCAFTSLQECVFFINYYITKCKDISDINIKYNSYLLSDNALFEKGYS